MFNDKYNYSLNGIEHEIVLNHTLKIDQQPINENKRQQAPTQQTQLKSNSPTSKQHRSSTQETTHIAL
jgi:hypothetical protein